MWQQGAEMVSLAEEPGSPQGPLGRWQVCREYAVPHIRLRQMAQVVKESGAQTVLDLGCHNGELGRLLPEVSYVGCDFVEPENPSFAFMRADLNREGIPAGAPVVEAVVASGILEYIEDLPALLADVRRHLRPNGVLIASYFNMNHLSRVLALLAGRSFGVHPDWRGFHSPLRFRQLLTEAGFAVERVISTSTSLRPSPAVGETLNQPVTLSSWRPWSPWLAHQLIYLARSQAAPTLTPGQRDRSRR